MCIRLPLLEEIDAIEEKRKSGCHLFQDTATLGRERIKIVETAREHRDSQGRFVFDLPDSHV